MRVHGTEENIMTEQSAAADSLNGATSSGRGVLDAAFLVLQAVSEIPEGCGLSQLARETGLAKATAYRVAEQLVSLGAMQRVEQRYFVGSRMADLGRHWQAAPMLRQAAQRPGRLLAAATKSTVAVCVLQDEHVHRVAGFQSTSLFLTDTPDSNVVFHTAMAQVLLAGRSNGTSVPPSYTSPEWRRVRSGVLDNDMVAVDRHDLVTGLCCAAAAIRMPGSTEVAAIGCLMVTTVFPPSLPVLVTRAAREVEKNLR